MKEEAKLFHTELRLQHHREYSKGWLQHFNDRNGLKFCAVCGEKRSADKKAAVHFFNKYAKLIMNENLSHDQIYNTYETALFWKCTLKLENAESLTG